MTDKVDSATSAGTGPDSRVTVTGTIERFTFKNPETGFAVVQLLPERGSRLVVVGALAQLAEGQRIKVTGIRREHPRFGVQIEAESTEASLPSDADGIVAYLGSGLVKGVGPGFAEKIVKRFGAETLHVIETEPDRLREVPGLGKKRRDELVAAVKAQQEVQEVLVFLRAHGLGPALAAKIVKRYGKSASALIQANPYRLADELVGVGFKTADKLAHELGMAPEAPERIQAGTIHTLQQAGKDGHCFLPEPELLEQAAALLGTAPELVAVELPVLAEQRKIVVENAQAPPVVRDDLPRSVYPMPLHAAEVACADAIDALLRDRSPKLPVRAPEAVAWYEQKSGMRLPAGQKLALERALTAPVSVITGGPGVGKTTIVRALAEILGQKLLPLLLAAPTGRAAKRLEESTGRAARTLHRLLEYQPGLGRFVRDAESPLEGRMLVVDEASMLDVMLAEVLLRAVPGQMKLVLVGDQNQLPAVGPGNVLADLIACHRVPTTHLTEIFRQAKGSQIVQSAHAILRGEVPESGGEGSDFYFVATPNPIATRALVKELVCERIPRRFGLDPIRDVQVLCPMYRGEAGADAINSDLQNLLNPGQLELQRGARTYRVGDKVMQIKNDYELEVYNGDVGRILAIDKSEGELVVRFGDREVEYSFAELDQLVPAYAISVHRSQGSEYPAVVLPLSTEHFLMQKRSVLYTAVTRGKQLVVLVGSRKALEMAVRTHEEGFRHTSLAERLREKLRSQ